MQVVILAGGKGTRMGDLTTEIPKPLIPIAGKPILEYQIELVRRYGHREILLLTGYRGERVSEYCGDGSRWDVSISYRQERVPLGTAGALRDIAETLNDSFFVLYGDIVLDIDLDELALFHGRKKTLATLVVHPNSHPYDSDLLEMDENNRVIAFHRKPHDAERWYHNMVNAGVYCVNKDLLGHIAKGRFSDLGRDIFPALVESGEILSGYSTAEYVVDVGTVDRLKRVSSDIVAGKVARLNRSRTRKAIFLDRDGVINYEHDHVTSPEHLTLLPGAVEAVKRINGSEYLAVVITNQPMIAKGLATEADLDRIHKKFETLLGAENAYVDRIYFCPHHPEKGFAGERPELKVACDCRKPFPGMIFKAASDLNIDLKNSYVVGDRTVDVQLGRNAGCKTVLVRTGYAGEDKKYPGEPDVVVDNLFEGVEFVLRTDG